MKQKIISIILCLSLVFVLSACGGYTEEIELTKDNFNDYFNVNIYNSDYREEISSGLFGKDYGYSCLVNIEISKATDFELNDDVCITYFINSAWDSIPDTYQNDKYHRCIDIKIPSSGTVNKKIQCTQSPTLVKLYDKPEVYVEDIVGTIRVKK